ncbi:hypothetical protein [Streptomyces sp. NPDC014894]
MSKPFGAVPVAGLGVLGTPPPARSRSCRATVRTAPVVAEGCGEPAARR